ncbi:MAG: MaoC family dehydratase N-terminal domain-containing protein [Chloroflexi bacterium]|nr:MaoC family dehydratase N-terminal domain-containing protein [Chloroflexota bacterium]
MAAPALLSDLPKGHEFPATGLQITAEDALAYLDAVQDANSVYQDCGLAPPLAVAALALGALLDLMELPPGALHTGQQFESAAGVPFGASLTMNGRIAQRSERAGLIVSAIEFEVTIAGADAPALTGRTTVMAPSGATP